MSTLRTIQGLGRALAVSVVLGTGLLLWIQGNAALKARRNRFDAQAAEVTQLREQFTREQGSIQSLRAELAEQQEQTAAALAKPRTEAAKSNPVHEIPPTEEELVSAPRWDPGSPYVWVPKSVLAEIPANPFTDSGGFSAGITTTLAISAEQERRLNQALSRALKAATDAEARSAVLVDTHPEEIASGPGEKITLRVEGSLDASLQARSEVERTLEAELGQGRAALIEHWGKDWMDRRFGTTESEPKTYSVSRAPDGTYSLRIQTGTSAMSVGGTDHFIDYIPVHLRDWFTPLLTPVAGNLPEHP